MRSLYIGLVVLFGFALPLRAADYQAEYQAFNEALQSGKVEKAKAHGEAAWKEAKKANADGKTVATLAYNYGALVFNSDPEASIAAFRDAIEHSAGDGGMFGGRPPDLYLAFAQLLTAPDSKAYTDELEAVLEREKNAGSNPTMLSGQAWLHLARVQLGKSRYGTSERSADTAIEHLEASSQKRSTPLADAYVTAGIARIAGSSRRKGDHSEAYDLFGQAIDVFPPQESIDSFDSKLATAYAWRSATTSAAISDYHLQPTTGLGKIRKNAHCRGDACQTEIRWLGDHEDNEACNLDYSEMTKPKFPFTEATKGNLAAVFIGFEIKEDGTVDKARVLSEVPSKSKFGDVALKTIQSWQFEGFKNTASCRRDRTISIAFALM